MSEAIIAQQARILDPTRLPGYMEEVARYRQFTHKGMHLYTNQPLEYKGHFDYEDGEMLGNVAGHIFYPESPKSYTNSSELGHTISKEEFDRITGRAAIGEVLYPYAIEYLQPLNISNISDLKDWTNGQDIEKIHDLKKLKSNIYEIAPMPLEFYAQIWPDFGIGKDEVRIRLSNFLPNRYNHRAVSIDAEFDDPEMASEGLRGLNKPFPEVIFEQELFVGTLPEEIENLYKESEDYLHAYLDYEEGLSNEKVDFDNAVYKEMTKEAAIRHLNFLNETLQGLDITPHIIAYYDDYSNLHYSIPVTSFSEVLELISRGYYDGSNIPNILGSFEGREIELDFEHWKWKPEASHFALRVKNISEQDGTLEKILNGVRS